LLAATLAGLLASALLPATLAGLLASALLAATLAGLLAALAFAATLLASLIGGAVSVLHGHSLTNVLERIKTLNRCKHFVDLP
jgi:hypothetical protein